MSFLLARRDEEKAMPGIAELREEVVNDIKNRSWRYTLLGIVSLFLGLLGLAYAGLVTVTSVYVFGVVLVVAGGVQLYEAFRWHDRFARSAQVPIGLLEVVAGALMVTRPGASILGLTLLLASFFIVSGVYRAIVAGELRFPGWGWSVASGIVSVLAGILVWAAWPAASAVVLGIYICVYCISAGWAFIMLGMVASSAGREIEKGKPAPPFPQAA
jgi:uncharacterized membrane protein HdeD (DUF308 family)